MKGSKLVLAIAFVAGCSDYTVTLDPDQNRPPDPGAIQGRVCDPSGRNWMADAMAYTNVYDDQGLIVDIPRGYSDRDGWWTLPDLPGDREYTVYVQFGNDVLATETIWLPEGETVQLEQPDCFDPLALDIALVTGDYDDIHLVLESMGFANYTLVDGSNQAELEAFLSDVENLKQFDLLFFNGGHVEKGIFYDNVSTNPVPPLVLANLRQYVAEGGSVYASDWSYDVVERAWPDMIDFLGDDRIADAAQLGEYDFVDAAITDESLSTFLDKPKVDVEYDLPVWPPIVGVEPYVSTHLTGTVHYREGTAVSTLPSVPLLVSFSGGEGRVGYASFRVAANHHADMVLILQYMMHEL